MIKAEIQLLSFLLVFFNIFICLHLRFLSEKKCDGETVLNCCLFLKMLLQMLMFDNT